MAKQRNSRFEVFQGFERLIDAGKTKVRHLVQLPQRAKNGQANLVRIDFRRARGTDILFDFLGQHGEIVLGDRASLACLADTTDHLDAAERLADAGPS